MKTIEDFLSSSFLETLIHCQVLIDQLTENNMMDSVGKLQKFVTKDNLCSISSSLLSRILLKPQDAIMIMEFIIMFDEIVSDRERNLLPKLISRVQYTPSYYISQSLNRDTEYVTTRNPCDTCFTVPISMSFLLQILIERKLISEEEIQKKFQKKFEKDYLFIHLWKKSTFENANKNRISSYFSSSQIEFKDLIRNDFELHKQYLASGFNPSQLARAIRNDDLDAFMSVVRLNDIDLHQKIPLSIYDCNFMLDNLNFFEYSAFFGSINIFKFLKNCEIINTYKLMTYAVIGGNVSLIHLVESEFGTRFCPTDIIDKINMINPKHFDPLYEFFDSVFLSLPYSLAYHQNEITEWLVEMKNVEIKTDRFLEDRILSNSVNCFFFGNWIGMKYLIEKGFDFSYFFLVSARFNNIDIFSKLIMLDNLDPNKSFFVLTAIHYALYSKNIEMLKLLIKINDVNLEIKGVENSTPLEYCCFHNLISFAQVLLSAPKINVHESLLAHTVCLKNFKCAKILLKAKKFDLEKLEKTLSPNDVIALYELLNEKKINQKKPKIMFSFMNYKFNVK